MPQLSFQLQIGRDLLPSLAFLAYIFNAHGARLLRPPAFVMIGLVAYIAVGCMQFLNPTLLSPLIGLLGLRTHFAYLPLLFLAPVYIRNGAELNRRLVVLALMTVPVVALGVLQTRLPASHPLNGHIEATFGARSLVRATGTFSYITGYGVFCQFALVGTLALLMLRPLRSPTGFLAVFAATFAFVGCMSSGSRAALFGAGAQIALFAAVVSWTKLDFARRRALLRLGAGALLVGVMGLTRAPDVYLAFRQRAAMAAFDVHDRLASGFIGWMDVLARYPFGNGIGMAHQQAGTLVGGWGGFLSGYEEELSRVAYEVGVIGFMGFALFRLGIIGRVIIGARALRTPQAAVAAALSASTLAILVQGAIYTPIANALFMIAAGLGLSVVQSVQLVEHETNRGRVAARLTS